MNKVLLIGRVARDVEVKTTPNGRDYSFNAIACKREYKNKDGKYDSDFVPVTFGDVPCKFLKEYVDKGYEIPVYSEDNMKNEQNRVEFLKQLQQQNVQIIEIIKEAINQHLKSQQAKQTTVTTRSA